MTADTPDLRVDLGSLALPNPILTASGCFASGREVDRLWDVTSLGAIVVKSLTLEPREGLPTPRMAETPAGMLNAIGLQNPGIDRWVERDLPWLRSRGARVIASIAGNQVEDYRSLAVRLGRAEDVAAIEINLSCPNVEHRGLVFACDPERSAEVVGAVRSALPSAVLFAKLTPDVTSIADVGQAVVEAGANGVSAINTTLGLAIDPVTGRPRVANGYAGLSGPAIRPMAVRAVHQLHQRLGPEVPIVGMGGIRSIEDVVEFVRAGASAVAVGTAGFADPFTAQRIVQGLGRWLQANGFGSLAELRGQVEHWPHHDPAWVDPEPVAGVVDDTGQDPEAGATDGHSAPTQDDGEPAVPA